MGRHRDSNLQPPDLKSTPMDRDNTSQRRATRWALQTVFDNGFFRNVGAQRLRQQFSFGRTSTTATKRKLHGD